MRSCILLVALTVAGCVTDQAAVNQQREADLVAAADACPQKPPVERANCINGAESRIYADAPFPDLRNLRQAYHIDLATKEQNGQITHQQALLEYAKVTAELTSEAQRRQSRNASVAAQQMAAGAAIAAATPRPMTCNSIGTMTTCY